MDYGSGKGTLKYCLSIRSHKNPIYTVFNYEPAFGIDERRPCDLVICRAVLEHVEPDLIEDVLHDLRSCTLKVAYLCIGLRLSADILPDGSNAHKIIESADWWGQKISPYFIPYWRKHSKRKANFYVRPNVNQ